MADNNFPDRPQVTAKDWISLPAETIHHILRYLDPQDLIRLRAVSTLFQTILCDPVVWRTAYSTARLLLPPGPYPWQSTRFHQLALVRSARLARTWTTEPLTLLSRKIVNGPRTTVPDRFQWVSGRWLIMSRDMRQLCVRDVEMESEQVVWDRGSFSAWETTSVRTSVGHVVYVVLHCGESHNTARLTDPVELLEFVADDDSGRWSSPEVFEVPTWSLPEEMFTPRIQIRAGFAPYVYISLDPITKPGQSLLFHIEHRRFYKFPHFQTRLELLLNYRGAWLPDLVEIHFTRTHVFVISRCILLYQHFAKIEVNQTFAFPDVEPVPAPSADPNVHAGSKTGDGSQQDPARPSVAELRLTHEMLSHDTSSTWLVPIRDAVVDPVTGSTTLRFMHAYPDFQVTPNMHVRMVCTDYILPRADDDDDDRTRTRTLHGIQSRRRDGGDATRSSHHPHAIRRSEEPVLPITVVSHDLFSVPGDWKGNVIHASCNGYVRGLCVINWRPLFGHGGGSGSGSAPGRNVWIREESVGKVYKFTVDATGDRCVAVVGEACVSWDGLDTSRHDEYAMDGVRGKLWHKVSDRVVDDDTGVLRQAALAIVDDFV